MQTIKLIDTFDLSRSWINLSCSMINIKQWHILNELGSFFKILYKIYTARNTCILDKSNVLVNLLKQMLFSMPIFLQANGDMYKLLS